MMARRPKAATVVAYRLKTLGKPAATSAGSLKVKSPPTLARNSWHGARSRRGHCARQQDGAYRLGAVGQGWNLSGAAARGSVRRGHPMGG